MSLTEHPEFERQTLIEASRQIMALVDETISESADQYGRMQQAESAGHVGDLMGALASVNEIERRRATFIHQAVHDLTMRGERDEHRAPAVAHMGKWTRNPHPLFCLPLSLASNIYLEIRESIPYFQCQVIIRQLTSTLVKRLSQTPAVALLGSRQVGKTTLARGLDAGKPSHYLDLERPSDIAKLADPELYLGKFADHLVILDEVQRLPGLFPVLRSLIDERRRVGEKSAQFLILGSASPELLQQSSETLAGRISYLELNPLNLTELGPSNEVMDQHWFRGGYPDSYLAADDATAVQWCEDFITSYIERHLPQLGITATPLLLRRLCTMLAHQQGATLNLSKMAGSLGIDGKTARHYLDLLGGLYLVRSIPAWSRNAGKRLVKAPKVYWRDSGVLHTLAGLHDLERVLGHPLCGHSWEGYCIEQIVTRLPKGTTSSHYRTHAGAEVDLVLEYPSGETVAFEIKRTLSPKLTLGFIESMKTLQATTGYYIIPQGETFPLSESVTAISLSDFLARHP